MRLEEKVIIGFDSHVLPLVKQALNLKLEILKKFE